MIMMLSFPHVGDAAGAAAAADVDVGRDGSELLSLDCSGIYTGFDGIGQRCRWAGSVLILRC